MISIIIPVYNAEKHLRRCLESLVQQTYRDIEIILVDDGSSDTSCDICKEYSEKYDTIKYIRKTNGGVSSARNEGLKNASGDYYTFVDSDDWVEPDYVKKLLLCCQNNDCDIAMCSRIVETASGSTNHLFDDVVDNKCETFNDFLPTANHFYGAVWGAMFSHKVIENIFFDESISFGEDMLFFATAMKQSQKICRTNELLYHYWKEPSENSLSKGKFSEKKISNLEAYRQTAQIFCNDNGAKNIIFARYCDACCYFINLYYKDSLFYKKYYKSTLKEYRNYYKYNKFNTESSLFNKICDAFLYLFPKLYLELKHLIKAN